MESSGKWCLSLAVLVVVISDTWAQTEGWLWTPPEGDAVSGLQLLQDSPLSDSTPTPRSPQRSRWPQRPQWPQRMEQQQQQQPRRPQQPKLPQQTQGPQRPDPQQTQGHQWPEPQDPQQVHWLRPQGSQESDYSLESEVYQVPMRPKFPQQPQQPQMQKPVWPQYPQQQRPQHPQQPQQPQMQKPLWPQQQLPQHPHQPQQSQPQWPQRTHETQRPLRPQQQLPQQPHQPQQALWPQQQLPLRPHHPQQPQRPQQQLPLQPQQPQLPPWPQQPLQPQRPQQPQLPQMPMWNQNSLYHHEFLWDDASTNMLQDSPADTKCAVEENTKITCGTPDITEEKCQTIDCCHDGRRCYYGKAVTVQCTKDGQFVLVIARDTTVPTLNLDSLSLLGGKDAPCSPVAANSAFAIFQFPVTECGTNMIEDDGFVIYENNMLSMYNVAIGTRGAITRDSHFELLFQCRYSGSSVEAVVVEVLPVPPPLPISAVGTLRVQLRLANGQCLTKGCSMETEAFTSFYSEADYPVTKVLREPVYVEVNIQDRTDPSLVLMLDHCWVTASPSDVSLPQWDLLYNGCPYQDDRYLTTLVPVVASPELKYPSHHKRFILQMFTFVDQNTLVPLKDTMFVHCSVSVCHHTVPGSCVQSCNRKRRAVPANQRTGNPMTLVSSREIILQ